MDEPDPDDDWPSDLIDRPLDVTVYKDAVVLFGPYGVHIAITAEAAERSADLLLRAARQARAARG